MFLDKEQKEIEAEFMASWNVIEEFFAEDKMPRLLQMLPLVRALRARGYDRKLRAGRHGLAFIVSRSQYHGLRAGQPSLAFYVTREGGIGAHLTGEHVNVEVRSDRIEITPEIENLLIPLLAYPID